MNQKGRQRSASERARERGWGGSQRQEASNSQWNRNAGTLRERVENGGPLPTRGRRERSEVREKEGQGSRGRKHTGITSARGNNTPEGGGQGEETCKRKFKDRTDDKNISW